MQEPVACCSLDARSGRDGMDWIKQTAPGHRSRGMAYVTRAEIKAEFVAWPPGVRLDSSWSVQKRVFFWFHFRQQAQAAAPAGFFSALCVGGATCSAGRTNTHTNGQGDRYSNGTPTRLFSCACGFQLGKGGVLLPAITRRRPAPGPQQDHQQCPAVLHVLALPLHEAQYPDYYYYFGGVV